LRITNIVGTRDGIDPFSTIRAASLARWQAWFEGLPPVAERYRQTYAYAWWILANNLVSPLGHLKYEAVMPTKAKYIGLWLWDSALHALALRHVDPELARNQIRVFLAHQLPDGMLPDAVFDEGVVTEIGHPIRARVTKPPVMAWAALKIHRIAPDLDFLREIYLPLVRWNEWWFAQSDEGVDGLAQYNHPYSSGLDDSPLWDLGMPVVSPDLNTYLCLQMKALGQMAAALGLETEAAGWQARSAALLRLMVERLWDSESGLFHALYDGKPVPVLTPFNLYPLWTGDLPGEISERLLGHLKNPEEFWGKWMLPTVARNDPKFAPATMWRGPVWVNVNYFFIEALESMDLQAVARELRDKTLELLLTHGIYEYYHAETGQPPGTAAPMFSWSAAVFIDLAIRASL
jgi:glycogen debranching enzyme